MKSRSKIFMMIYMKKSRKVILTALLLFIVATFTQAQVGVGTSSPHASAKLEVSSTTKGFLPPRMTTTERNAITSPATGLVIFNTITNSLETRKSTGWVSLSETFVALPTIVIGTQQWMRENLDVSFFRNGDPIPYISDPVIFKDRTTPAWTWYDGNAANGEIYGKLYNWYAVNDSRGLCPTGWHVPTSAEWSTLSTTLDPNPDATLSLAGVYMKSARYISPNTPIWDQGDGPNTGTNLSGFTGLPGGMVDISGSFGMGNHGYWWTSTSFYSVPDVPASEVTVAVYLGSISYLASSSFAKADGMSVRCIRD
jgi:uncharacterized protein (TIGR02145 family)